MKKLLTLFAASLMAFAVHADELTVAEGTEQNASLPVCSYYFDTDFHSQMLYDVAEIESAKGKINSLTFYSSTSEQEWGVGTVSVKLAEVTETAMTKTPLSVDLTEVYSGSCSIAEGKLVINFTTPFTYSGEKNLLVEIKLTKKGTAPWDDVYFYGKEVSAASYTSREKQGTYTYAANAVDFLPKTTFAFDGEGGGTCSRPSQVTCAVTADGGVFTWSGEEEGQYQYCAVEKDQEADGWQLLDAGQLTCTVTGLTAGKAYDFHVRHYCSESEQSADAKLAFTPICKAPANLKMADLTHNSVTISWDEVAGISKYQSVCLLKGEEPNWTDVEAKAGLSVEVEGLEPQTSYDFYVRSWFSESTQSEAVKLSFTTNCEAEEMPFSENFENATGLPACWESNSYGDGGNAWSIGQWYKGDELINAARYYARSTGWTPADLKTAAVELSEHAVLKFAYQNSTTSEVLIFDGSEEKELLSVPQDGWKDMKIDLGEYTGKIVNIIFRGHPVSNASKYFFVDDVQIIVKPCELPTDLWVYASEEGALVTWEAGEDETVWNLRYKATDAEEWIEVSDLEENSYTIAGLVEDIEYEVQVQAACTEDKLSEWTESFVFIHGDEITALSNTAAKAAATKRLVNGQLIIERNGEQYNAQGVSVR